MKVFVSTARGIEPIDRQRFAPSFLAKHEASRLLGPGLVHAFSRTRVSLKRAQSDSSERVALEHHDGWATFCASGLSVKELPGIPCRLGSVTCVACVAALFR